MAVEFIEFAQKFAPYTLGIMSIASIILSSKLKGYNFKSIFHLTPQQEIKLPDFVLETDIEVLSAHEGGRSQGGLKVQEWRASDTGIPQNAVIIILEEARRTIPLDEANPEIDFVAFEIPMHATLSSPAADKARIRSKGK